MKKIVVVTPRAVNSDNMAIGAKYEWVPIYPGQETVNSNPAYAQSGFSNVVDYLKDPKQIPLFIAIDPFINETSTYADYIIPDAVL